MKFNELNFYEMPTFAEFGQRAYDWNACGPWAVAILADGTEVYYEDDEAYDIGPDTELKGIKIGSVVEGYDGVLPNVTCTDRTELMLAYDVIGEACSTIFGYLEHEDDEDIPDVVSDMFHDLSKHGEVDA